IHPSADVGSFLKDSKMVYEPHYRMHISAVLEKMGNSSPFGPVFSCLHAQSIMHLSSKLSYLGCQLK
ncbi:hypothetical protein KI387_010094, partial [Taxus chinensis]